MPGPAPDPDGAREHALKSFLSRVADPSVAGAVDAVAVEVLSSFAEAGIDVLLLKGPALARLLYRPGEQRRYLDVDLLVAPGSLPAVGAVLDELGFHNATAAEGVDDALGAVPAETWQRERHLLGVDVHARMPNCAEAPERVWPLLWADHQLIELGGLQVPVLSMPGLAFHVALHAAQHGVRDVKAMADLERGLERWDFLTWKAAAELAERAGAMPSFAAGLRLLPDGSALAGRLGLPSSALRDWEIANPAARPRGTFHLDALAAARGPREAAAVLRAALLPRRAWIERQYPRAREGRVRLVAAYAQHLARTPQWGMRAIRYRRLRRRGSGV